MKDFWEKHGVRILAVAVVIAVALSLLSFFSTTSSFLHNAAGVVTAPFRAAGEAVSCWVEDKTRYYRDYTALLEENQALRREVAELRANARQAEKDRAENALLRTLLELRRQKRDLQLESAMILDRSTSNWTAALTLNRGTAHDVAVNDCVISAEGYLIGVVSEVGHNWCTVLTVVDTSTELGAMVFRTGDLAIAEGDFTLMGEGKLKLSYLPPALHLLEGDHIVTSGLGGYFPSDLVIGTVSSVATDDDGLTQYAVLSPLVDFDSLTEVFIIKDFAIID